MIIKIDWINFEVVFSLEKTNSFLEFNQPFSFL